VKRLVLVRRPQPTRGGQPVAVLFGLAFALIAGAVLLWITGDSAVDVYARMWDRSLGSQSTWSDTINRAVPLALAGLAVSIAASMGLWNIGAEGQIMVGAVAATMVGRLMPDAPAVVLVLAMLVAAAIGGALWSFGPALARSEIGVSEIITTLMLTEVASRLIVYLEQGPWKDPDGFGFPGVTPRPEQAELPMLWDRTHSGVLVALATIAFFAWFLRRSVWGYELRLAGSSQQTAAYAGISVRTKVLGVMLISGAIAGFAGGIELLATTSGRLTAQISNGYGFAGIIVAALALMRPSGVAVVALAFGALQVGGQAIQTNPGVSPAVATILQALILFGAIAAAVFSTYRLRFVDRQTTS